MYMLSYITHMYQWLLHEHMCISLVDYNFKLNKNNIFENKKKYIIIHVHAPVYCRGVL